MATTDQNWYDFFSQQSNSGDDSGGSDQTSGNTAVDNGGDNGSIWTNLFNNAGDILSGAGTLATAFTGKGSTTVNNNNNSGAKAGPSNQVWMYIGLGVLLLVVLFMLIKSFN